MMFVLFGCLEIAQQYQLVKQPETAPDDLKNQGENAIQ